MRPACPEPMSGTGAPRHDPAHCPRLGGPRSARRPQRVRPRPLPTAPARRVPSCSSCTLRRRGEEARRCLPEVASGRLDVSRRPFSRARSRRRTCGARLQAPCRAGRPRTLIPQQRTAAARSTSARVLVVARRGRPPPDPATAAPALPSLQNAPAYPLPAIVRLWASRAGPGSSPRRPVHVHIHAVRP